MHGFHNEATDLSFLVCSLKFLIDASQGMEACYSQLPLKKELIFFMNLPLDLKKMGNL